MYTSLLTLILIRIHRKMIHPTNLPLPTTNTRLLRRQLSNLKRMRHIRIESKGRAVQNVRSGLQYHLARIGMDPMNVDATSGFVHYLDGSGGVTSLDDDREDLEDEEDGW